MGSGFKVLIRQATVIFSSTSKLAGAILTNSQSGCNKMQQSLIRVGKRYFLFETGNQDDIASLSTVSVCVRVKKVFLLCLWVLARTWERLFVLGRKRERVMKVDESSFEVTPWRTFLIYSYLISTHIANLLQPPYHPPPTLQQRTGYIPASVNNGQPLPTLCWSNGRKGDFESVPILHIGRFKLLAIPCVLLHP